MKVNGKTTRTIWLAENGWAVTIIDQRNLPHHFSTLVLENTSQVAEAIRDMAVRGAPLIGATAAYGVCLALRQETTKAVLDRTIEELLATRPTAINLRWALDRMKATLEPLPQTDWVKAAYAAAAAICEEDVQTNYRIGQHGLAILRDIASQREAKGKPVSPNSPLNILTHCNAGWLACVDWGTALAPLYLAYNDGLPIHVWVDETRPRNQGASLTTWELAQHGIPHTLIVDNAGGHLMQQGCVDLCLTGTDRTTSTGDVCNKIGTYLKALAAQDNEVPFYVALPSSTIDWTLEDGLKEIPIEKRDEQEITSISGQWQQPNGTTTIAQVQLCPEGTRGANYAFDVTPARLITGLITEQGVCEASREGLQKLFPTLAPPSLCSI